MASETFVSAMMLVTGVVAAAILIVAVLPVVWGMVGTFGSTSAATDKTMRTDFKIVTTFADYSTTSPAGATVTVWMKNTGLARVSLSELSSADVFVGRSDLFGRATWSSVPVARSSANLRWWYTLSDLNANNIWDSGETLQIDSFVTSVSSAGQTVYFQFTLPNSVSRSSEFTAV